MELSIVIPAKDEEKRLPATLASLCRYIVKDKFLSEEAIEVIVVVNNSTDQTYNIVKIFQKHFKFIRVFNIPGKIGKGGAIKYGFEEARGDHIAFIDADGSSAPHELFKLYKALKFADADIAIANRYDSNSKILGNIPIQRRFFSRGFRFTSKLLFGLGHPDTQCGLKVFKRESGKFLMVNNDVTGWTFDLNILIMANMLELDVIDVPTIWGYKRDSTLQTKSALKSVSSELVNEFKKYRLGNGKSSLKENYSNFYLPVSS